MHIAYLTAEYPHPELAPAGGIGTFLTNLSRGLTGRGHQVSILLLGQAEEQVLNDGQVTIYCMSNPTRGVLGFYKARKVLAKKVQQYIRQLSIDLLEAPDFEGWHAFLRPGIPVVTRLHGSATYFSSLAGEKPSKLLRWLEGKGIANSRAIVPVTDFAGKRSTRLFDLSSKISQRIYYGIDTDSYKPPDSPVTDQKIVLYYGTLARKKGVYHLPAIFNRIYQQDPTIKLIIAGKDSVDVQTGGSTWQDIHALFNPGALQNVSYTGPVAYQQMQQLIARAKVCVFPSMAETFGLVTAEAMAMEKPVVAYDMPWVREIVRDKREGILVPPGDFEQAALAISKLIDNPSLRSDIGRAARNRIVSTFSLKKAIETNIKFYKSLI